MKERIQIKTVGFEGLHRSGKGTQIEILKNSIEQSGIPCIVIRGAGSRPNANSDIGDTYSKWWETHLDTLRSESATKEDWIEGSRRLAREVMAFKKKLLPELAYKVGADRAVLLIDRSILSHMAMLGDEELNALDPGAVYGKRDMRNRNLPSTQDVFPDIIFYLKADPSLLYSRLDPLDPKYEFRKKNIDENTHTFDDAISKLPADFKERIVEVDAGRSVDEVSKDIADTLHARKDWL